MVSTNRKKFRYAGNDQPAIGISKDNTIIKANNLTRGSQWNRDSGRTSDLKPIVNKGIELEWNKSNPFHLAVEPWISAPLITDVPDGIYIGNLKGSTLRTSDKEIQLTISMSNDYPEAVVVLIKSMKAYIFKTSQLTATTGSRVFSRYFSDISSDEEFRSYAHNLMKSAHKDNYSKELTDKVVTDLLKDHKGSEYGELVGRLKSGLGNKKYSVADQVRGDLSYTFEYQISEPKMEMQAVIGTLVMSIAFGHLFHLCSTEYAPHMALQDYYQQMPDMIDKLAENYLEQVKSANFQVCIVPTSSDPVLYFDRLREYIVKYKNVLEPENSAFLSLLDDIVNLITGVLYKLKRLASGRRLFSFNGVNVYFSKTSNQDIAVKTILAATAVSGNKKLLGKDVDSSNEFQVKQFVRNKTLTSEIWETIKNILSTQLGKLTGPIVNDIVSNAVSSKDKKSPKK